jgi:N-formylglutamate amidohydrolase
MAGHSIATVRRQMPKEFERRKERYFAPYHAALVASKTAGSPLITCGWYPRSADGIAMPGYLTDESDPPHWDNHFAKPIQEILRAVLDACLAFARS